MNFSFLDSTENVSVPPPMQNAGLYSGIPYKKNKWAKDYSTPRLAPDAVEYSSQYFELAKGHIPTSSRPGNNSIPSNKFLITDTNYNTLCYVP